MKPMRNRAYAYIEPYFEQYDAYANKIHNRTVKAKKEKDEHEKIWKKIELKYRNNPTESMRNPQKWLELEVDKHNEEFLWKVKNIELESKLDALHKMSMFTVKERDALNTVAYHYAQAHKDDIVVTVKKPTMPRPRETTIAPIAPTAPIATTDIMAKATQTTIAPTAPMATTDIMAKANVMPSAPPLQLINDPKYVNNHYNDYDANDDLPMATAFRYSSVPVVVGDAFDENNNNDNFQFDNPNPDTYHNVEATKYFKNLGSAEANFVTTHLNRAEQEELFKGNKEFQDKMLRNKERQVGEEKYKRNWLNPFYYMKRQQPRMFATPEEERQERQRNASTKKTKRRWFFGGSRKKRGNRGKRTRTARNQKITTCF